MSQATTYGIFPYDMWFSVAKATLEIALSSMGVVMLNRRCGYVQKGVVMFSPLVRNTISSINFKESSIDFNHQSTLIIIHLFSRESDSRDSVVR